MPYLGNTPTTQNFISGTDYFNGTGSQTAFTLSRTVNSVNDIQVTVNNVVQQPNDAYTLSGTTLTMTSAPSAGTNNVYVRYLSTTTQVITPSQNTVSWNTLDTNTQNDLGLMYKNKIINGNMVIDQRNAGAAVTAGTTQPYTLDRWISVSSQNSKFTIQQNAGSVTPPAGFTNYLGVTSSSAYSVGASENFEIQQRIEGFNTADLNWGSANAKTVTLSFWVRSSLTGTFGGFLCNGATDYSYPFSYTISSANTWTLISTTITGPTAGTWIGATNGIGIFVGFSLGAGSSTVTTAGSWNAALYRGVTGQQQIVGTNGATWYITGVQLEVGTQATAFSTAGGSYGAELALCQRYYEKGDFAVATARVTSSSTVPFAWTFKVPKRGSTSVTVTYLNGNRVGVGPVTFSNSLGSVYSGDTTSAITWETTGDSTNNGAYNTIWNGVASAEL